MSEPEPYRGALPPDILKAVKTISRPVWGEPYRPLRGPVHYATGHGWPDELDELARKWERQAVAARVVAEFMRREPNGQPQS